MRDIKRIPPGGSIGPVRARHRARAAVARWYVDDWRCTCATVVIPATDVTLVGACHGLTDEEIKDASDEVSLLRTRPAGTGVPLEILVESGPPNHSTMRLGGQGLSRDSQSGDRRAGRSHRHRRHGRSPLDLGSSGSTTNQVMRRATCPVLTVRR
jgi:hypothetical protein